MENKTREEKIQDALAYTKHITSVFPNTAVAKAAKTHSKDAYRQQYFYDPVAWCHDCVKWKPGGGLAVYQEEILEAIPRERRVSARGPHGLGKTGLAALSLLWFSTTRDGLDWKVITTASVWRQLIKYLWPEVHKWSRLLKWEKIGRPPFNLRTELMAQSLKLKTGEAFAVASDEPSAIEGAHADYLFYIFDESKAIIPKTFDAAEGAFSGSGSDTGHEAYALAISTPGELVGRFFEIHQRYPGLEDWWVKHVTLEDTIRAGRNSREWAENRKRQWGVTSSVFQNRVMGEFSAGDDDGVIPLGWLEQANQRWLQWKDDPTKENTPPLTTIGVDVADGGSARTVLALRYGHIIKELRVFQGIDQMETVGHVMGILRKNPGAKAIVDSIGVGAGVVARLKELNAEVYAFNAGQGTKLMDQTNENGFLNKRAAGWWTLREKLDPRNGYDLAIPPDEWATGEYTQRTKESSLTGELCAPKYKMTSAGKYQIEAKDQIIERLERSTDLADAIMMSFFDACLSEFEEAYQFFTPIGLAELQEERDGKKEVTEEEAMDKAMWGNAETEGLVMKRDERSLF